MVGSSTAGSPLFSLNPTNNFYREDILVELIFPIGKKDIHFLSNYDNTTFFLGQSSSSSGSASATDIYLVEVNMFAAAPYCRVHQMPTLGHVSEGLAFFPLSSHPVDTYEDVSGPGEKIAPLLAVIVCAVLLCMP